MENVGEEICGAWLRYVRECEIVDFNLATPAPGGEVDVIGLNLRDKQVYVCEVAIHLTTGLLYVKNNKSNNKDKLWQKFSRAREFATAAFQDFDPVYMLWSPVVKESSKRAKSCQLTDVRDLQKKLNEECGVRLELVINGEFRRKLEELRNHASKTTSQLLSPTMRFLQIESFLNKHLERHPHLDAPKTPTF